MSLKEFLKEQAVERRGSAGEQDARRREWVEAVDGLLDRLVALLKEADPENVLTIEKTTHRKREKGLGTYDIGGLAIGLGTREILVEPVARNSLGSMAGDAYGTSLRDGRVDITNGERKFMLFRHKDKSNVDLWTIVDDRDYRGKTLDQPAFEEAILSLLK